jgi:opacity protein-like surface antigen
MSRLVCCTAALLLTCALWPSAVGAQTLGGSAYVSFGQMQFASAQTFEAVFGSARKRSILVGGTVSGIWRGLFADVSVSQVTLDGQRVFVDDGDIFPLGIATTVKVRPFDVIGGWRFDAGRLSPYVGGGFTVMSYSESDDFTESGEGVDDTGTGPALLAGVDVQAARLLRVGGELRYRSVRGVLGTDGASAAFGEDQLGGFAVGVRVSLGR